MTSFEKTLLDSVKRNILSGVKDVLASDEAKSYSRSLGRRKLWPNGKSPLHLASSNGWNGSVRLLARAGFDLNSYLVEETGLRVTSLHLAVGNNRPHTVKLLLSLGADCTLQGWCREYSGGTALEWARKLPDTDLADMIRGHSVPVVNSLVSKVGSKTQLETELGKATAISDSIEVAREKLEMLDRKRRTIVNVIATLAANPDYRSTEKMKRIRLDLQEIGEITQAVEKVVDDNPDKQCPVCFEAPEKIFSCVKCHNWICGKCWEEKGLVSCPSCRMDFKESPPTRNFTAERLLRKN